MSFAAQNRIHMIITNFGRLRPVFSQDPLPYIDTRREELEHVQHERTRVGSSETLRVSLGSEGCDIIPQQANKSAPPQLSLAALLSASPSALVLRNARGEEPLQAMATRGRAQLVRRRAVCPNAELCLARNRGMHPQVSIW